MLRFVMQICLSTQFGHAGDGYGGRSPTILYDRPVSKKDIGIAHRRWPIGSKVLVVNVRTGLEAEAVVLDRGPYGKVDDDGKWFNGRKKKNREREGEYRGCADLTPRLARLIGHKGLDPVVLILLKRGNNKHGQRREEAISSRSDDHIRNGDSS